ncbi:TylF/MycF/NovP-related O-methyltransferase [Shimia abyssi]|uniref:Macrocin-O-methyltransferase TylF n=1 Tax=Shimia abyssi TaxID=1662395 RepID=A0A2P8FKR2_9RHOB|nr:TylF/MycF/NovP-related O-methyltransferase [Shimia abyssi]PSL22298.1 macrocin-O-methyltransferase TylF [Shimia abyssi]
MFYGNFSDGRGEKFQAALKTLREVFGSVYASDNLIGLQRAGGFREDARFVDALKRNAETEQELSIAWRLHTLLWAAQNALNHPGDFVECGVWKGFCFAFLTDYLDFSKIDKTLYLYDTFLGIPEEMNSEIRSNEVYAKETASDQDAILNIVKKRFENVPNTRIVPGKVPDSFADACPEMISLLHIDMNSAASEIAALEALFDKVVPGAMILFDDYGWTGYAAQRHAENAFMAARGHQILELPTGQGLVIKH